ncbi:hypothetical protein FRC09_012539 [Ceratobasidium sp. 395]|nr:hypothetical protein FRC09_012539 [Ceratobasidium sp. 395]
MLAFWPKYAPIAKHYTKYTRGAVEAEGTALDQRQLAHLSTWAFGEAIYGIAASPDGLSMALAINQNVRVVDSSSGAVLLGPLQVSPNTVQSVAFSPDGSRILSGSYGREISFGLFSSWGEESATILGWDTRTGEAVLGPLELRGHTDSIICLVFSPDCSRIVTGSSDKTLRLWDTETGQMIHRLEAQDDVNAAVFSPDGTQIAAIAGNSLHRLDSRTGTPIHAPLTLSHDATHKIHTIVYSPDQSRIISLSRPASNAIHIWDALSGNMIRSLEGPAELTIVTYSPDGRYIASGCDFTNVCVWDARSGDMVLGPLEGHTGRLDSVIFSSDSSRIISACVDGLVCTWDVQQRSLAASSPGASSDSVTCAKLSSDGTHFVSGSTEGAIYIRNAHTGEIVLGPVKMCINPICAIDFKNDRIVSASDDGVMCVCDARSGKVVVGPLRVCSGEVEAIAYSPNGELIATISSDGVDVWSAQDGSRVLGPLTELEGSVSSVQFSPDGTRIAASSSGSRRSKNEGRRSNLVVWNVSDGSSVFGTLDGHWSMVESLAYSPNSALIALGTSDTHIILWDACTGKKAIDLRARNKHYSSVCSVNFSPDGTRLVSGSFERILIQNVETGEIVSELCGHKGTIQSVEYSLDGSRILSFSDDQSVQIHDARSPEERAQSRSESEVGDWTINKDGWVVDEQSRLLVWVPGDLRKVLMWSETRLMIAPEGYVRLMFDKSWMGESWAQNYTSQM